MNRKVRVIWICGGVFVTVFIVLAVTATRSSEEVEMQKKGARREEDVNINNN